MAERMWPFWGLDRARCDLLFTEAINQRMQVPNRLKVAGSYSPVDEEPAAEDLPPSFRMHIPERISLAGNVPFYFYFLGWLKNIRCRPEARPAGAAKEGPLRCVARVRRLLSPARFAGVAKPALGDAPHGEAGLLMAPLLSLQLTRISVRLRVLEEQCNAWQQKEAIVYSVLISACLVNTWLWLRR
uniref:Mitochondrial fission factor n=1 Tax=Anas zonorhyncha TaxID=75864 RepID=A0A8B9UFS4_9AVES